MEVVLLLLVALFAIIMILLLIRKRLRKHIQQWQLNDKNCKVLLPGLVFIESVLEKNEQCRVAQLCFQTGLGKSKRFFNDDGKLTGHRQRRGRVYDNMQTFDPALAELCREIVHVARTMDTNCAKLGAPHTHLLLLYYCDLQKGLGWHRDDGRIDGQSLEPVVSLSLGCACIFEYKMNPEDTPNYVRLNSGDAIVFGGPSRHIMHAVTTILPDTCPISVAQVHERYCTITSSDFLPKPNAFRLNLTWRHAPELYGLESSDRFFHFGNATREYLDDVRSFGIEEARRRVRERRQQRKLQKIRKKQENQFS